MGLSDQKRDPEPGVFGLCWMSSEDLLHFQVKFKERLTDFTYPASTTIEDFLKDSEYEDCFIKNSVGVALESDILEDALDDGSADNVLLAVPSTF